MEGLILKEFLKQGKVSPIELSRQWGTSKQNVYEMFKSRVLSEETKKLIEKHFKTKWGTIKASVKIDYDLDRGSKVEPPSEPLTIQALVNLTESNKILAESNKTLATSHAELVTMVKGSTVRDLPGSVQDDSATLKDLLEVLAEVGVSAKKWHSKEEGLAALHRISVEYLKRKQVVDTRSGSGTKNRAKA
jgi:hypothetical protein